MCGPAAADSTHELQKVNKNRTLVLTPGYVSLPRNLSDDSAF